MGKRTATYIYVFILSCMLFSCKKEKQNIVNLLTEKQDEIFLTPNIGDRSKAVLLIIDNNGDTIKMKNPDALVADFRKWVLNGKTYYSYLLQNKNFYTMQGVAAIFGYRVVTDSNFNEINRFTLLSHDDIDAVAQPALETHDFLLLAENHYIALAYYEIAPSNIPVQFGAAKGKKVVSPVIQEVVNGNVIWQWVGTDYPDLYETSIESNEWTELKTISDYLHVNSMFIDPYDGNLIISCRNSDQLIKLNRKKSGIVWQLGGINSDFAIPPGMQFLRQHFATVIDNKTILLLDNGDTTERSYSRVLEFDLDETSKTITGSRAFTIPGNFIRFAGSVQKFGDTYFIGGGTAQYAMEVNHRTKVKKFEMPVPLGSYRVLKY